MSLSMRTLAECIKAARTKANVSQGELAKALGYGSSQFISNWERGVSRPPKSAIPIVIAICKMDPVDFHFVYKSELTRSAEREADRLFAGVLPPMAPEAGQ